MLAAHPIGQGELSHLGLSCDSREERAVALSIPREVADLLVRVSALDDTTFDAIARVLNDIAPVLYLGEFDDRVSAQLKDVDADSVEAGVRGAIMLSLARETIPGSTADEKASNIANAIPEKSSLDIPKLSSRISRLLRCKGAGLAAKASEVLFESPSQLLRTRVLSDIRPIFDENADKPVAGMIVHALKIEYTGDRHNHEFFVALDTKDIALLIEALTRALKKDVALADVLKTSGVQRIEIVGKEPS